MHAASLTLLVHAAHSPVQPSSAQSILAAADNVVTASMLSTPLTLCMLWRSALNRYYWILGRVDDVINVSGHRIGTAEVESALVGHHLCAEAAVVVSASQSDAAMGVCRRNAGAAGGRALMHTSVEVAVACSLRAWFAEVG